jgi:glycosyltransferase involved in cell wall biosynthesis
MAVTILITTRDRAEFLAFVLGKVVEFVRPNDELIAIDDGSRESMEKLFEDAPGVVRRRFIRHEDPQGQVCRRSEGMELAENECILQLDDDAWPVERDGLLAAESAMAAHPRVGAFALPIHHHWSGASDECDRASSRWSSRNLAREMAFMGCGALLRKTPCSKPDRTPVTADMVTKSLCCASGCTGSGFKLGCSQG